MGSSQPDVTWAEQVKARLDQWLADPDATDPTSQITGAGAVAVAERRFSQLHQGRPALMVSSGTAGMLAALRSVEVGPGTEVLIPAVDWPGTMGVVQSLGATPVVVPVEPETLTMQATEASLRTGNATAAAVVCHPLGIPVDIGAIRTAIGAVPIIEDCAQALGSTIDDTPVGCLGDLAVFSFGPGKPVDIGEGGMVLACDFGRWEAVLGQAGHPVRQLIGGISEPCLTGFACRPHPLAAVLLATALREWDPESLRQRHYQAAEAIRGGRPEIEVLGVDQRRRNAASWLPVRLEHCSSLAPLPVVESGLFDIDSTLSQLAGIGVVPVASAITWDVPGDHAPQFASALAE